MTGTVRATVHVTAGEPHGLQLAHDTITGLGTLTSVASAEKLLPLAAALASGPSPMHGNWTGPLSK